MAIELHCEHCGNKISAGDESAGQHIKCAACHQSVYVPTPSDRIETLDLEPVDQDAERKRQRSLAETREFQRRVLHEKDLPAGKATAWEQRPASSQIRPPKLDMDNLLVDYAVAMAAGDLAGADRMAADIRTDMPAAEDVMQRLTLDEIPPPKLAHIPRPVLVGFFKQLRSR